MIKIRQWWQSLRYYVIADPADNSVTLSKQLFRYIRKNANEGDAACVFVFRISENDTFGFMVNPAIDQPTQLCDIQYNDKYRCIGFETLCPSVGSIFYHYGLPADRRIKMSVSVHKKPSVTYYQLDKPNAEYIRKYTQG